MAERSGRGWIVIGCITDNACSAGSILKCMDGNTCRNTFAILISGMTTSNMVMQNVHMVPEAVLMPLMRNWNRFGSVVFMMGRFIKIADQLPYVFRQGDFALAVQALGPASDDTGATAKVKECVKILQESALQATARNMIAWLSPLSKFEGWPDSIYASSVFNTCLKLGITAKVQHI